MAHLYGHERVWIEAFHSSGWGGTLADTYDWLLPFLRSGANLYNPHASYFGTAGGWFEWAPPSTDWRQPYWQQYPAFSRAVARICSIMSWGTYSADVAVLHPTATMQSLIPLDAPVQHFGDGRLGDDHADVDETQRHYLDLCGTNNWLAPQVGSLDRHRIAFDIIDDASVQRATAAEGALRVTDLSYRAVLLPSASVLEEETARLLTQLLDAGGRVVIVGRPPATAAGMTGDDSVVAALLKHPRLERASDAEAGAAAVADTSGHATGEVPLLVRREGVEAVALVTGAFPDARTQPGDSDHEADPARYARHSTVTVQAAVTEAEIWNPANGTRRPAQVTVTEGRSTIEVPLEGAPAVLVVWREGAPRSHTGLPRQLPCRKGRSTSRPAGRVAWSPPWTTPGATSPCPWARPSPNPRSGPCGGPRPRTPMPTGSRHGRLAATGSASSLRCRPPRPPIRSAHPPSKRSLPDTCPSPPPTGASRCTPPAGASRTRTVCSATRAW